MFGLAAASIEYFPRCFYSRFLFIGFAWHWELLSPAVQKRVNRQAPRALLGGPPQEFPAEFPATLVHERTLLPPHLCETWFMLSTHFLLGTPKSSAGGVPRA